MGAIGAIGYGGAYGSVAAMQYASSFGVSGAADPSAETDKYGKPLPAGMDEREAKRLGKVECETCKERKYQDGSDEQVSFKSATTINPAAAEARVRGHEQEHVANAYDKAEEGGGKVLRASIRLKFAVCPECGRSYCAGGVTDTTIKYPKDDPYSKNENSMGQEAFKGNHLDLAV
ncbi:MAG: hypothetical protein J6X66_03595 [Lachnospiraceae bacterium]|nr:hypothetical protein [Lachnospiraceae bacterium]